MARVSVIDPKTATGAAADLLNAVQAPLGVTPNFIRVLANSPKALEGFLGLYGAAGSFAVDKATQERIALAVAGAMRFLAAVLRPLVFILSASSTGLLRLFGASGARPQPVSEEEIKVMIDQGIERQLRPIRVLLDQRTQRSQRVEQEMRFNLRLQYAKSQIAFVFLLTNLV